MLRAVIGVASTSSMAVADIVRLLSFYYKPEEFRVFAIPAEEIKEGAPKGFQNPLTESFRNVLLSKVTEASLYVGVFGEDMLLPNPRKEKLEEEHCELMVTLVDKSKRALIGGTVLLYPNLNFRFEDILKAVEESEDVPERTYSTGMKRELSAVEALVSMVRLELGDRDLSKDSDETMH